MSHIIDNPARAARLEYINKGSAGAKPLIDSLYADNLSDNQLRAFAALVAMWTGNLDRAVQLAEAEPRTASQYGMLAELASFNDDQDEAARLLKRGLELDPDDYFVLRFAITSAQFDKRFDDAHNLHRRTLELFPEDHAFFAMQRTTFQLEGKIDQFETLMESAPSWFKSSLHFHTSRGFIALLRHDLQAMETDFQAAAAMAPESFEPWTYLAMSYRYQGRWDEAERAARIAVELCPISTVAWRMLANVEAQRGNVKQAKEYERKAENAIPALSKNRVITEASKLVDKGYARKAVELVCKPQSGVRASAIAAARRVVLLKLIEKCEIRLARTLLDQIPSPEDQHFNVLEAACILAFHEGRSIEAIERVQSLLNSHGEVFSVQVTALQVFVLAELREKVGHQVQAVGKSDSGNPIDFSKAIIALDNAGYEVEARELHRIAQRKFPHADALRVVEAGLAAGDNDLERALRIRSQLPTTLRPKIGAWRLIRAFFRGVTSRLKSRD